MRWLCAAFLLASLTTFAGTQSPKVPDPPALTPNRFTGARPTPPAKIIESIKTGKAAIYRAAVAPPQVIVVPKRLSYWGNNQYGCCVTSESVFAIADYSTSLGMEEI